MGNDAKYPKYALACRFFARCKEISFDHTKKDPANHLLRALDVNGLFVDVEIEGGFNWLSRWLNNDYLIIYTNANDHTKPKYLLDPFSGQTQPFPAYPMRKSMCGLLMWYWFNHRDHLSLFGDRL